MGLMKQTTLRTRRSAAPSAPSLFDQSPRMKAFDQLRQNGGLTKSCDLVLGLIKRFGPITIQELEERHNVKINIGSGRCSDLERMGYIVPAGEKVNPVTHRKNTLYRAVE